MPNATLKPNDRYAIVGKTGSGKTQLAIVLSGTFAGTLPAPWEVWWIDTKGDPGDIAALRKWGFRNAASTRDQDIENGWQRGAIYWKVESTDKQGNHLDVIGQCQHLFAAAYQQGKVIVCIDEYTSVVASSQRPGSALGDIFARGRGRNVGIIGCTQEPVYIPRQLISQASHLAIMSLSFPKDIQRMREIDPEYKSPNTMGDKYGFYWGWLDGQVPGFTYYHNQQQWYQELMVSKPAPVQITPA